MTTVTVLAVGGTGESWPGDRRTDLTGLLAEVGAHLDHRFRCRWVGYPSSYGPVPHRDGMSFAESVAVGSARLQAAMAVVDGPVMLIGYSQGCVVIRDALSSARRDGRDLSSVLGVGLVADPHQPPGAVAGCEGFGIAGPGPALPPDIATMWIADPNDMICNASDDSLIRDIADLTSALSLRDVASWMRRIGQTLRANAFQNAARTAIRPRQWRRDITRIRTALV
ncbi:MAG: PE-PPE domain-containing protein, partial [Corynebacteriales bacterium]|nr:PE-PPE domain-containing protein [Mycobacteriales bacterium]